MFEQAFRNIDDVLRKEAGCTTELDYWILLLRETNYLTGKESESILADTANYSDC